MVLHDGGHMDDPVDMTKQILIGVRSRNYTRLIPEIAAEAETGFS